MKNLTKEEQENIFQFVDLSLSLIQRGFDEMEMPNRMKLVKLLGFILNIGFERIYGGMIDLEKRVAALEQKVALLEQKSKKTNSVAKVRL